MNTNKFGAPKILGRFKLSILIALVVVLCSSALMIAKLNADVGVANLASQANNVSLIDKVLDGSVTQADINREIALIEQKIQDRGMQSVLDEYGIDIDVAQLQADYKELVSDGGNVYTENQPDGIKSRFFNGYERKGPYAHNDKGGIQYLTGELALWGLLLGCSLAVAAATIALGTLATLSSAGGLTGVAIASIKFIFTGVLATCIGNAWSAMSGILTALSLCERGYKYTIERQYIFGITSGYSVY